jgi:hypothetical protein
MTSTNAALALADTDKEQWDGFLKSVAAGASMTDAMQQHRMLWREVESLVLGSPLESQRWRDAKLLGAASKFSLLEREDLFARIARGVPVETALVEVRGTDEDVGVLFELIEGVPDFQERFDAAQRARDLREEQSLLDIVDDTSRDILDNGKGGQQGNTAGVLRSRLRWEARTWRLGKNNPTRWGEQKASTNVQVNLNYAEILENAQHRAKVRDKVAPKITQRVIDATFSTAPAEPEPVVSEQMPTSRADALRDQAVTDPVEPESPSSSFED